MTTLNRICALKNELQDKYNLLPVAMSLGGREALALYDELGPWSTKSAESPRGIYGLALHLHEGSGCIPLYRFERSVALWLAEKARLEE